MFNHFAPMLLLACAAYIFFYQMRDALTQDGKQSFKSVVGAVGFVGHYLIFAGAMMLGSSHWWASGCEYGSAALILGMALRRWFLEQHKQAGGAVA